jgi:ATP-dependent Clp protease ATP-binding subunit ClpA
MCLQVLGRNLEGVVNSAMDLKKKWGDQFCSVEHLVLALAADTRFGEALFKAEGLTKAKLEEAVKEVRRVWGLSGFRRVEVLLGGARRCSRLRA